MKEMSKKLLAFLLAFAFAAVALTGCGASGGTEQKDGASTAAGSVESTAAGGSTDSSEEGSKSAIDLSKKVTLTMVTFGDSPADLQLVNDEINKLTLKDLNCDIKISPLGFADFGTKYNLMLTSGQPVDMIWTATWMNFQAYALKGAFLSLDELLPKAAPDLQKFIPEDLWSISKVNGKSYCIPTTRELYGSWGLLYREDLRVKYGLPEVKDLSTVEAFLEGIKKNEKGMLPMSDSPDSAFIGAFYPFTYMNRIAPVANFAYGFGIRIDKPRELVRYWETPEFTDYCKLMKSWSDKGYIEKGILSKKSDVYQEVVSGKSASVISGTDPGRANTNVIIPAMSQHPDWKFGYLNWGIMSKVSYAGSPIFMSCALPKSSENPERALAFLEKAVLDQNLYRLLNEGIEGKHFKMDNGYYVSLNDPQNPGFIQNALYTSLFTFNKDYAVYSKEYDFVRQENDIEKQYVFPNYWDTFPEDYSSYSAERAALSQVNTQYAMPLLAGLAPDVDAGIKTLLDKAKTAGYDKIYDEYNKQWQKYLDSLGVK
jgi:putative aldouronate transport system substrate-binding protein